MTFKVPRSKMPANYEPLVAVFAKEQRDWRAHMKRVEEDKKNKVAPDKAHAPYPAPAAHPNIVAAIDENGNANYEIVDDSADVLLQKKNTLLSKVAEAAQQAIQEVMPSGKSAVWAYRYQDLLNKENQDAAGFIKSIAKAAGLFKPTRSADEETFMADMESRRTKVDAIHRAAAQMMSDVEDLTIANVDSWKMPDFPK